MFPSSFIGRKSAIFRSVMVPPCAQNHFNAEVRLVVYLLHWIMYVPSMYVQNKEM